MPYSSVRAPEGEMRLWLGKISRLRVCLGVLGTMEYRRLVMILFENEDITS